MGIYVADTETDGLNPTLIHCAVFKNRSTKSITKFVPEYRTDLINGKDVFGVSQIRPFVRDNVTRLIGHNFFGYDMPRVFYNKNIVGLTKEEFPYENVIDTIILSRLWDHTWWAGHSIEGWGQYFKRYKPVHEDWSKFSDEMLHRCVEDVEINDKLYDYLQWGIKKKGFWTDKSKAIVLEHRTQVILNEMQESGFFIDLKKAHELLRVTRSRMEEIEEQVRKHFPAKVKALYTVVFPWDLSVPSSDVKDLEVRKGRTKKVKFDTGQTEVNPTTGRQRKVYSYNEVIASNCVGIAHLGLDSRDVGGAFTAVDFVDFNLGSSSQVVERMELAGWDPVEFNKPSKTQIDKAVLEGINPKTLVGSPKVSEVNLDTLPDDAPEEVKLLKEYRVTQSRNSWVQSLVDCAGPDCRVRGTVNGMGARTHRATHKEPNMGNPPSTTALYGKESRELFTVSDPETRRIVGYDASGIQLRVLAHYMGDPDYTHETVFGDIHTKNMFSAGIEPGDMHLTDDAEREYTREEAVEMQLSKVQGVEWQGRSVAKTFIYAFLLGAGNKKVENITKQPGAALKERFLARTPGLARLRKQCAIDAKRGYMVGLDGRRIPVPSEHLALSCYLQGGEAIIMKVAMNIANKKFKEEGLDAFFVAWVHDENQVDCHKDHAERVGQIGVESIIQAGKILGVDCPLDAEYKIGLNWAETH
jgi:DNA polymerase I